MKNFESYEDFYQAYLKQLEICVGLVNEEHNIAVVIEGNNQPDALVSVWCDKGVEYGRDLSKRPMIFENGSVCNMVGMVCVANSLAAIKKVVFEDKKATMEDMFNAVKSNWEGYEWLRKLCLDAPKYGNGEDYVDDIAARCWNDYARICRSFTTAFGAPLIPTATSITAHVPGGATVGATPDGRMKGETLADGSVSPAQGDDRSGPMAVLRSGMKLPQDDYMATLLNLKFTPGTLKTDEDLDKLASLTATYLTNGGKHVQYNVVDKEVLEDAKANPSQHRDLLIRVAGYSTYFTLLQDKVQDEIIERTANEL